MNIVLYVVVSVYFKQKEMMMDMITSQSKHVDAVSQETVTNYDTRQQSHALEILSERFVEIVY